MVTAAAEQVRFKSFPPPLLPPSSLLPSFQLTCRLKATPATYDSPLSLAEDEDEEQVEQAIRIAPPPFHCSRAMV